MIGWKNFPDEIPTHFNVAGRVYKDLYNISNDICNQQVVG